MTRNAWKVKRRKFRTSNIQNWKIQGTQSCAELDTQADTSCGGTNFWLHDLTGKICIVSTFSDSYNPIKYVQTATCLTAYTDEYGKTCILVFNEVLWFRTSMNHLLINPNQIRMAGIPVSDDPFEENKNIGINNENVFIPLSTYGKTVYFYLRVPIQHEITDCTHIVMTGD